MAHTHQYTHTHAHTHTRTHTHTQVLNIFPCSSKEFIANHGIDGARRYLALAKRGVDMQKAIGREVLDDALGGMKELGSLYVCLRADIDEFYEEYRMLVSLGVDREVEWWDDEDKVAEVSGSRNFCRAIFFPNDAVIDSSSYSRALLRSACATGCVTVIENCPSIVDVSTAHGFAITQLSDGTQLRSKHCVLATGGKLANTYYTYAHTHKYIRAYIHTHTHAYTRNAITHTHTHT